MTIESAASLQSCYSSNLPMLIVAPIAPVPLSPPARHTVHASCRLVGEIVNEMSVVISGHVQYRRDRRRRMAHVRQIAMYVCHVCLQIPQCEIGRAFGLDSATVRYACHIVEERRDDSAYEAFLSSIERMVKSVFNAWEDANHA